MDSAWADPLVASTPFSQHIPVLFTSGHYEHGPPSQSAQIQNNIHAFGGLDEGFARPPHMEAQPSSNPQDVYILNSSPTLQGGQYENGTRALAVDFQSSNNAIEACSLEAFPQGISEGSVSNVDIRSVNAHGVVLELNNQQQFEARRTMLCGPRKRKRKRDSNWTKEETSVLVDIKEEAMREKGRRFCKAGKPNATNWDAISAEMKSKMGITASAKTGDQCRLRWDTLVKSYQKINAYCKKSNKEFSELTEEERGELRLATTFSEDRWYEVITQFCRLKPRKVRDQTRDDLSRVGDGQRSVSAQNSSRCARQSFELWKSYCPKQVAIPGFNILSNMRRSTLLDLINGSIILADVPWVLFSLNMEDTCQWLSILQNRSPSKISWDVNSLVKKRLVHKESGEDGKVHLNFSRLGVYKKFVKKVACKNPDFDTYRRIWDNNMITFESRSLPQRITTLTLGKCPQLVEADLRDLPKLRCLVIIGCIQLEVVTGWEHLRELGWLAIQECPSYHNYPTVQCLPSLKNYFINQVENNQLPWNLEAEGSQFVRLCRLEIWQNEHLKDSGDLSLLKCLQVLRFRKCSELSTIRGLDGLHLLTTLDLSFCCALSRLPYIGHMKALVVLDIFATAVEEILGIEELVSLKTLDCTSSKLKRLPDLHHLPQLECITLREASLVEDPSSIYFGKGLVEFYGEEKRMVHVEVSDISDSEHNHSECEGSEGSSSYSGID